MNRFSKLLICFPILSFSPTLFAISCGGNATNNLSFQKEITDKFKNIFIQNPNLITSKNIGLDIIKNFVTFTSWSGIDQLLNDLNKYFTIDILEFKKILEANNYEIYNNIKKVTIQPQENSKDLTIIFYLFDSSKDSNIVSTAITNALSTNFVYANKIDINLNPSFTKYQNVDQFNQEWSKISDPKTCEEVNLKAFLEKIFTSTTANWTNIIFTAYTNNKLLIKNNNYKITIQLLPNAINEGYIFNITPALELGLSKNDVFITSENVINN